MLRLHARFVPLAVLVLAACSDTSSKGGPSPSPSSTGTGIPDGEHPPGGVDVALTVPQATVEETSTIRQALADVSSLDTAGLESRYAVSTVSSLGYDPRAAAGLDKINASAALAPSAAELDALGKNGFVISETHRFPTFTYGYETIYSDHLPLYVSADSILDALHRSYDNMLEQIETSALIPELGALLGGIRTRLAASAIAGEARADIDFYLAVALGLLTDAGAAPVAGGSASDIQAFVTAAKSASGSQELTLFGVDRTVDLSQFEPRGHYTDSPQLEAYFRAMMWLGRIDFRLIETQEDGSQLFYRRQFDAMLGLASLFDEPNATRFDQIDRTIQAFVGESDNMRLPDVARLLSDLGAPAGAITVDETDLEIAQTILDRGYGAQRIASQIMINGTNATLPLDRAFLIFGQRYTVDSHVFSNVVYDRVQGGKVLRMMPNPLDAAFAALGNDAAAPLLQAELDTYHYAPDLASMRVLVDAHDQPFWDGNLYNVWLSSLRALSTSGAGADPAAAGLPAVVATEPWGRRILNTQLASWAELRHDTILYVKQSYTGGPACEFPDAYVDPYPEFYAAMGRFVDYATEHVVPASGPLAPALTTYFDGLRTVAQNLHQMAIDERAGTPFSAEQMAFINDAVTIEDICGGGIANGWYPKLVYGDPLKFDPTIADVHTQPFDEAGAEVGRVLHVGTGSARAMIVTVNTCTGPRAYAGLASSYFEKITEDYERLKDEDWAASLNTATPADVPWMADLVVR